MQTGKQLSNLINSNIMKKLLIILTIAIVPLVGFSQFNINESFDFSTAGMSDTLCWSFKTDH